MISRNSRMARAYWFGVTLATSAVVPLFATGTADTDVSAAVDNLTATWGVIKPAALAILIFLICVGLLKKGYRKAT